MIDNCKGQLQTKTWWIAKSSKADSLITIDVDNSNISCLPSRCFILPPLLFSTKTTLPYSFPLSLLLRQRFHRLKPPYPHPPPPCSRFRGQRWSRSLCSLCLRLLLPQNTPRLLPSISNLPTSPLPRTNTKRIFKKPDHFRFRTRTRRRRQQQPLRKRSDAYVPRIR